MSVHTKIPRSLVEEFQAKYFDAFPCILKFQRWVAWKLQTSQFLTNAFGIRRDFFARPEDKNTIASGMAFLGASSNADDINLGLWRVWKYLGTEIDLLTQEHDAIYFQADENIDELELLSRVQALLKVEFDLEVRKFSVPTEAKTGWNKGPRFKQDSTGKRIEINPRGLDRPGAKRGV